MSSASPSEGGSARDTAAEEARSVRDVIARTVFAAMDRHLGYPSPSLSPAQLVECMKQRLQGFSFGLNKVSVRVEISGAQSQPEPVAVIELTLCREDSEEQIPLQVFCPLFPGLTSLNQQPFVHVEGQQLTVDARGPGKAEYALSLLKEAADAMHNLHAADVVNDKAKSDASLAPVQRALQDINAFLRETLRYPEGE